MRDADVDIHSTALLGRKIALGITGGIAATESIRLCRELRRHGAEITVMMTTAATKVITPLAVGWASQSEVMFDWKPEMSQLETFDAVLIAPASRNFISRYVAGMMDHPLLMTCSTARSRGTPTLLVPSMHQDLFDDPVTESLLSRLKDTTIIRGPHEEGRYKQPNPVQIVAELCHIVNRSQKSKHFVVTLGANRAPIDAVRAIQNASSGRTGWAIAEYLYRFGHEVTAIAGKTSASSSFILPNTVRAGTPDGMLEACLKVAKGNSKPDGWVHSAAVLDYYSQPLDVKKPSGKDVWAIELKPGRKHISELSEFIGDSRRIGFKLETGVELNELHNRAKEQLKKYGVDATIANLLEEINNDQTPRAYLVTSDGMQALQSILDVCEAILDVLTK
tara:strand:+ start:171 stop:1346 length:1176 start_codon:yes stop_codon:yes gene_type:complete